MADLDTRSKRASSVQLLLPWMLSPVLPDGTIALADRQHTAWSYSGIAALGITGIIATDLSYRTLALDLDERSIATDMARRTIAESMDSRQGVYMPSLMRLEDDSGYWLFENSDRIMWEAGDVGQAESLSRRSLALDLEYRE